jgi:hypothetical protein
MTGLTEQEFTALLSPFEHALATYMQDRTIDGQPRTSRRYSAYDNCPLPTIPRNAPSNRPLKFLPSRTITTSTSVVPLGCRVKV